jgi:hypothetical protein
MPFSTLYIYTSSLTYSHPFISHYVIFSDFIKIRDWGSWSSCAPFITAPSHSINTLHQQILTTLSHLPTQPQDDVLPDLTTAQTKYNPKATKNLKVCFRQKDQANRWKVTEEERGFAKSCKNPKDLDDFTKEVCFPSSG